MFSKKGIFKDRDKFEETREVVQYTNDGDLKTKKQHVSKKGNSSLDKPSLSIPGAYGIFTCR